MAILPVSHKDPLEDLSTLQTISLDRHAFKTFKKSAVWMKDYGFRSFASLYITHTEGCASINHDIDYRSFLCIAHDARRAQAEAASCRDLMALSRPFMPKWSERKPTMVRFLLYLLTLHSTFLGHYNSLHTSIIHPVSLSRLRLLKVSRAACCHH